MPTYIIFNNYKIWAGYIFSLHLPQQDRICNHCHAAIEDEVHFWVSCHVYDDLRYNLVQRVSDEFPDLYILSAIIKYIRIMNTKHVHGLGNVSLKMHNRRKLFT